MAAFVLSVYVYVYLRIRGPPGAGKKKAINRKEEYEEKEEYEAILGAGNEEGLKQKEEYEGKEERSIPFQSFPSLRVCLRPSSFYL